MWTIHLRIQTTKVNFNKGVHFLSSAHHTRVANCVDFNWTVSLSPWEAISGFLPPEDNVHVSWHDVNPSSWLVLLCVCGPDATASLHLSHSLSCPSICQPISTWSMDICPSIKWTHESVELLTSGSTPGFITKRSINCKIIAGKVHRKRATYLLIRC